MAKAHMEIRIADWPEALWTMRKELANLLRRIAHDENVHTARRLQEIALIFEAGASDEELSK